LKKLLPLLFALIVILSACGSQSGSSAGKKGVINIYTTVYPLQYFAQQIGGKYVNVKTIYPPGSDEHTYEPSQKDIMSLANAQDFFYIGLGLEGFVNKAKTVLQDQNVKMVAAGDALNIKQKNPNPHVWLDPIYAKEMAYTIYQQLAKDQPQHKNLFKNNYTVLAKKLDNLDAQFKSLAQHSKHKEFIVTHAAYSYWGQRYGINEEPISGVSTTDEPSQKKLKEIIDSANKQHIKYVIFENNVAPNLGKVVESETGTKPLFLHDLAVLRDIDIKKHETYFTLMENNLKTLNIALNH
jgi:zinc transport system substrate-binding protein